MEVFDDAEVKECESSVQCETLACQSCSSGRFVVNTNTQDGFCFDCNSKEMPNVKSLMEQVVQAKLLVTKGKQDLAEGRRLDAEEALEAAYQTLEQVVHKRSTVLLECQKELIAYYENTSKWPQAIKLATQRVALLSEDHQGEEVAYELAIEMSKLAVYHWFFVDQLAIGHEVLDTARACIVVTSKAVKLLGPFTNQETQKKILEEHLLYCCLLESNLMTMQTVATRDAAAQASPAGKRKYITLPVLKGPQSAESQEAVPYDSSDSSELSADEGVQDVDPNAENPWFDS